MRITRSCPHPIEKFLHETITSPAKPVAIIVVGESATHRQAVIDFLSEYLDNGLSCQYHVTQLRDDIEIDRFQLIVPDDAQFRLVNVSGKHSGNPEARRALVRRLLGANSKTIVMIWVDFNAGDPLPDWSHFLLDAGQAQSSDPTDGTRVFQWDPAIPECRPSVDEADIFYHLQP